MTKSVKIFDMLRLIKEYPNLNAEDLARLCDVSVRGIYRYLNTLSRAGIPVRFQNGGYKLQEDYSDVLDEILRRTSPESLETLIALVSAGMQSYDDDRMSEQGKDFIKQIQKSFPKVGRPRLGEIQIV